MVFLGSSPSTTGRTTRGGLVQQRRRKKNMVERPCGFSTLRFQDCLVNMKQVEAMKQHICQLQKASPSPSSMTTSYTLSFYFCTIDTSTPETLNALISVLNSGFFESVVLVETSNLTLSAFQRLLSASNQVVHMELAGFEPIHTKDELMRLLHPNTTVLDFWLQNKKLAVSTFRDLDLQAWSRRNQNWANAQAFVCHQISDERCKETKDNSNRGEGLWPHVLSASDANAIHHALLGPWMLSQNQFYGTVC